MLVQRSAPPHQEQPAGRGRPAAADRRAQARGGGGDRRGRRPGAGDRPGLRPAGRRRRAAGDRRACSRRSPARCSAPSAGRSAAASQGPARAEWTLPEAEAIPIALTLNELLTNAIKHSAAAHDEEAIGCVLDVRRRRRARSRSRNRGRLPAGFSLARIPSGVSGLGLVRALLPRRSARLSIEQTAERVVATVSLQPARSCSASAPHKIAARGATRGDDEGGRRGQQGNDPGRRRQPAGAGDADRRPDAGRLRGHRRRQRRRRDPARARAPAGPGAARHPHGRQERLRRRRSTCATQCRMPFMFLSAFSDERDGGAGEGARRGRLPRQAARHQADRAGGRGGVRAHRARPRAGSAAAPAPRRGRRAGRAARHRRWRWRSAC